MNNQPFRVVTSSPRCASANGGHAIKFDLRFEDGNWISRRAAAEAIRHDPEWNNGDYEDNPSYYIWTALISTCDDLDAAGVAAIGAAHRKGQCMVG